MPIVVVQHREFTALGGWSSNPYPLATFSVNPTIGNSIFAQINVNGGGPLTSITDNYGNNLTLVSVSPTAGGGYSHVETDLWWLPVLHGGSGTYTISANITAPGAGGAPEISIIEVSGLAGTVDQVNIATDLSNTATALSVTAPSPNSSGNALVLTHIMASGTASGITAPPNSGYVATLNAYGQYSGGYKILTNAVETSSAAWTWTGAAYAAAVIATFPMLVPSNTGYWSESAEYF